MVEPIPLKHYASSLVVSIHLCSPLYLSARIWRCSILAPEKDSTQPRGTRCDASYASRVRHSHPGGAPHSLLARNRYGPLGDYDVLFDSNRVQGIMIIPLGSIRGQSAGCMAGQGRKVTRGNSSSPPASACHAIDLTQRKLPTVVLARNGRVLGSVLVAVEARWGRGIKVIMQFLQRAVLQ